MMKGGILAFLSALLIASPLAFAQNPLTEIAKYFGIVSDLTPEMITFTTLAFLLYFVIIWAVLEEIRLFKVKRKAHIALALIFSLLLLPLGVVGATVTLIVQGGALLTIFAVMAVFLFGLGNWARIRIGEYGYERLWIVGGKYKLLYFLSAAGVGTVFGMVGFVSGVLFPGTNSIVTTAIMGTIGAGLGLFWAWIDAKRGPPLGPGLAAETYEKETKELMPLKKREAEINKQLSVLGERRDTGKISLEGFKAAAGPLLEEKKRIEEETELIRAKWAAKRAARETR